MDLMMGNGWNEVNIASLERCVSKLFAKVDYGTKGAVLRIDLFGWRR
jgi:hypothetical protein